MEREKRRWVLRELYLLPKAISKLKYLHPDLVKPSATRRAITTREGS